LLGKIPSTASNGAVVTFSSIPSSGWTNVKGDVTGNSISLTQGTFSMNAMTVKAGSLSIGKDATFASKTIVPGGTNVEMARFQLDAQQSGEDVRVSSFLTSLAVNTATNSNELSACQFYDGSTALNTGSNVLNPSATSFPETDTTTFDQPLLIAKGTVKTLSLKCNVSGSATDTATFAFDHGAIGSFSVTGATSGNTITATSAAGSTATITIGSAGLSVSTDASSPGYMVAAAGSTGSTIGAFRFTTTNEAVNLTRVGLQLSNTASSTPSDLLVVKLFDGATQVGTATFVGSSNYATSTLDSAVNIPANSDKTLTVKADFSAIGTGAAVTFSGHLVAVDVDVAGTNTQGVGASSGTTINATGSTTVSGVRVFKSFPTVALDTLSSTGVQDGKLMRFKVTADAKGPVSLTALNLNLATTTLSVTNVRVYGFSDASYSQAISGVSSDGSLQSAVAQPDGSGDVAIAVQNSAGTATTIQVPANTTRYFEVRGSIAGATTGASVTTKLNGDSSFPSTAAGVAANPLLAAGASALTSANFIWSPNSTTTVDRNSQDWTNGYGVPGLPSGGLLQTRSQ